MTEETGFIIAYLYDFVCSVHERNTNRSIRYNSLGMSPPCPSELDLCIEMRY